MANIRVKDLPNTNSAADTDEFIIDSSTAGTRRLSYSELKSEISTDFQGDVNTYKIATLASDNKLDPSQIPDTLSQGLNFVGVANSASDLTSTTQGDFYVIQTAFGVYSVGDQAVYDGSAYIRVTDGTKEISEGGTGATTLDDAKVNLEIIDVGTGPQEVPLNSMLSSMAYQSADSVAMGTVEADSLDVGGQSKAGSLVVYDANGNASNSLDVTYSGSSGVANIQADSSGGSTSLTFGTSNAGTVGTRMTIDSQGNVTVASGDVTATTGQFNSGASNASGPAFAVSTGNGIYNSGANQIGFSTNSTKRWTIDSSGSLVASSNGTGARAASQPIVFYGTNSGSSQIDQGSIGTEAGTANSNAGELVFKASNSSGALTERFRINEDGNIQMASGLGIDFGSVAGGTGTPATNGGLLDDYETGSFSPSFSTTGSGFTTVDIIYTNAVYTKIGNCVTFSVFLKTREIDATGATGNLCISGLPFTARSDSGNYSGAVNVGYAHLWANAPEGGYVGAGATRIQLTKRVTSITGSLSECVPTDMSLGTNTNWNQIMVAGHYYTS